MKRGINFGHFGELVIIFPIKRNLTIIKHNIMKLDTELINKFKLPESINYIIKIDDDDIYNCIKTNLELSINTKYYGFWNFLSCSLRLLLVKNLSTSVLIIFI